MRLLLDTHIYLWCVQDDHRHLTKEIRSLIMNAQEVYVSSVSIWEIAIKVKLGKLDANVDALVEAITTSGFLELPLLSQHIKSVTQLPDLHCDPFDRVLIAQALSEPLRFLTADKLLLQYSDIVITI